MMDELVKFIERELSEIGDQMLRKECNILSKPRRVKIVDNKGYAVRECWVAAQMGESKFYLGVLEGALPVVRHWGLFVHEENSYSLASHGVSSLAVILSEYEATLSE